MGEKSLTELVVEALRKMVEEGKFASTQEAMQSVVELTLRRTQADGPVFPEGSLLEIYTDEDITAELATTTL